MPAPRSVDLSPLTETDWPRWSHIQALAFGLDPGDWTRFRERLGDDNLWTLREAPDGEPDGEPDGQIIGGLGVYPLGKWLGGRRLELAGVSVVGVSPGSRGRGLAAGMVAESMRIYRGRGAVIAGLYASTRTVYRSVGFEVAGEKYIYSLNPKDIGLRSRELSCLELPAGDPATLALLQRLHRPGHGNLDRSAAIWDRILRPFTGVATVWVFGAAEGYAVVCREGHGYPYSWRLADVQFHTARAGRQILSFLADQRSMCEKITLSGGGDEPLLSLLPEQIWKIEEEMPWLLRVLDLPAAFSQRGWDCAEGEVSFAVDDPIFPDNSGGWRLTVQAGAASIARIDPAGAAMRLDVRALGPLLTGYALPSGLAARGLVEGELEQIRASDRLFTGPRPWMRDYY